MTSTETAPPTAYSLTMRGSEQSIVIFLADGTVRPISSGYPRFERVKAALVAGADEPTVLALMDAEQEFITERRKLSERLAVVRDEIQLDGDTMDNPMTRHLMRMIKAGDESYGNLVAFIEKLAQNPSKKCRKLLWQWLSDRDFTLTPTGDFIGYKGVQDNTENLSIRSGTNQVLVNGKVFTGRIPNPVGATIEMARSAVDDSREVGCSDGLHIGTYDFALDFGRKLLVVSVNPRDVVAIPRDSRFQKLRTCRYIVLAEQEHKLRTTSYRGIIDEAEF